MIGEKTLALTLTPLDVAFFRDGRAFGPGDQASGDLPAPQTLAGALRSLVMNSLDCDFEEFSRSTRYGSSFSEALDAQGSGLASVAHMRLKGV